jgi:hypothetical protein
MWAKWIALVAVWACITIIPSPKLAKTGSFVYLYLWLLVMVCALVVCYPLVASL